jgi:hypothetical protein
MVLPRPHDLAPRLTRARHCSMLLLLALAAACASGPQDDGATDPTPGYALVSSSDTLTLTPATITLAPGAKQRFRVRTPNGSKVSTSSIVWAATGGTISPRDSNVVYLAGSTPGSYQVTATISGLTLAASVTIGGTAPAGGGGDSSGTGTGGTGTGGTGGGVPSDASSCLNTQSGPLVTLAGSMGQYDVRSSMASYARVDARGASWVGAGTFPVELGRTDAPGICFSGGTIQGTFAASTDWRTYHSSAGMFVASPGFTVEDVHILNYGDAIRVEDYTNHWTIRRMHVEGAHDDCVEDDRLYSGLIDDSFFEGCYVFLSERPGSGVGVPVSGANETVTIQNSLVWHKPMPTVYKGPAPGNGPLFKWSPDASTVNITNTIFRVDQLPSHGDLNLPTKLGTCSGNTIVWLGSGAYPVKLPSCFTVTTDKSVWDQAVVDWKARH